MKVLEGLDLENRHFSEIFVGFVQYQELSTGAPRADPVLLGRIFNVIMNNVRESCLMSGMIKQGMAA